MVAVVATEIVLAGIIVATAAVLIVAGKFISITLVIILSHTVNCITSIGSPLMISRYSFSVL